MGKVVLAIDIGGTKTAAGLVREDGTVLTGSRKPVVTESCRALADSLTAQCDALLRETDIRPEAVGIGVKGTVDDRMNRLVSASILGGRLEDDLCAMIADHYALPCRIDNDVNAATLAEAAWGAGREHDTFAYVNVGTGTAIGLYDRGRLVRGTRNACGEIGYMPICLPGEDRVFLLESVASGKGLSDEVRRLAGGYPSTQLLAALRSGERIGAGEIFSACRAGDLLAARVVEEACRALTFALLHIECMTGAGLYVFGGGVVCDPLMFNRITEMVPEYARRYDQPVVIEMRVSSLGAADAGLLGAAMLGLTA